MEVANNAFDLCSLPGINHIYKTCYARCHPFLFPFCWLRQLLTEPPAQPQLKTAFPHSHGNWRVGIIWKKMNFFCVFNLWRSFWWSCRVWALLWSCLSRAELSPRQGGPELPLPAWASQKSPPKKSQSFNSCMDEAPWVTSTGLWADFR